MAPDDAARRRLARGVNSAVERRSVVVPSRYCCSTIFQQDGIVRLPDRTRLAGWSMVKSADTVPRAARSRPMTAARSWLPPSGVTIRKSGASARSQGEIRRAADPSRNQATKKACSATHLVDRRSRLGRGGSSGDLVQIVFHDRAVAAGAVALERECVACRALPLGEHRVDLGVIGGGQREGGRSRRWRRDARGCARRR